MVESGKILIVEDDRDSRLGLELRLRSNGYQTVVAGDGVSAVQAAQRDRPDLVLLDLGLPGGDGFTVLRRLKQLTNVAGVPVIVISARDAEVARPRALQEGAVAFLEKPIDNDALLATIAQHMLPAVQRTAAAMPSRETILIVEDDADTRLGFCARINASGYRAVAAADAVSAVAIAVKERPAAILLDLGLPGGDGFSLIQRFKENTLLGAIPVIVVSARDPVVHRERALAAGAVAFLQKPPDNDELLAQIRQALGK